MPRFSAMPALPPLLAAALFLIVPARALPAQDGITQDENFEVTEGLELVWKLQADPANVAISSVGAELEGMAYYDTEYRWPAVRGRSGSITVAVPRSGKFYPALVVYDTAGREAYELRADGRRVGRFVAAEDDNRQRVHFLAQPLDLRKGQKLTFRTGSEGSHITEDLLLLAARPPVRGRRFELSHLEAGCAPRDGRPQARLTWITTWPSACTVEYGTSPQYGRKVAEEEPLANHRVWLADVNLGEKLGEKLHYRVTAPRPGGREPLVETGVFSLDQPAPPKTTAKRERVALAVENPYGFALHDSPVSSGVPFARGELADAQHVRLLDPLGREVPVQPEVTVRWKGGSVKWLLVSFLATAEAGATPEYTLEYGSEVRPAPVQSPLRQTGQGDVLRVDTGPLRVEFDAKRSCFPTSVRMDVDGDGQFSPEEDLTAGKPIAAEITDTAGRRFTTLGPADEIQVERSGPVCTVVKLTGHHIGPDGQRMFACTNRFTFHAGLPLVHVRYAWGNDRQEDFFTSFDQVSLRVPLPEAAKSKWTLGLGGGKELSGQGELALRQLRDDRFTLTPDAPPGAKTQRADGWIQCAGERLGLTVAVRDFWQLYPKGIRMTTAGLALDLCPDFPDKTYDACSKLEEIKLYYYLMGGHYKVACGIRKQHELLLWLGRPDGLPAARAAARAFQEPLVAVCPADRYCGTGVFGEILPAAAGRWPEYEKVCQQVYRGYTRHRDGGREFGMLNYGDWWGERQVNWANGEYDNHHAFLLQFARTGDRRWYFLGEKAARHAIDVDTCHYGPRRGGEWIHSMGHTGRYFASQHEGNGIPGGGMTVSHTWTEGFCDWYATSGDPTAAENAVAVADHYDGAYLNNYDWSNCRTNGWHLILTMATYRLTRDPYYLNAARIIVERTLQRQTPGGGWHRQLVPGHCHDMPRHRGVANFMLGVLANGLEEYYREVPDPRVAEAVQGGARQAVKDLWVDECDGFRYTSCPNMKGYTANNDMTSEILFFAYRLGGDRRFGELAMRAMRRQMADGIGSIAHLRWTPHILYNMKLLKGQGVGEQRQPKSPATR